MNPTFRRVSRESSSVTRWPPLTRTKSLFPPPLGEPEEKPSIGLAPSTASGPTTRVVGSLKSRRPSPNPETLEQSATAPRGRSIPVTALVEATERAATAVAAAVLAINFPRPAVMSNKRIPGAAHRFPCHPHSALLAAAQHTCGEVGGATLRWASVRECTL